MESHPKEPIVIRIDFRALSLLAFLAFSPACAPAEAPAPASAGCTSGQVFACDCGGAQGFAVCSEKNILGACVCNPTGAGGQGTDAHASGGQSGTAGGETVASAGHGSDPGDPTESPSGGAGGSGGSDGEAPISPTALTIFCEETLGVYAARVGGCCPLDELWYTKNWLQPNEQLAQSCPLVLKQSAAQGRIAFSQPKADACIKAIGATLDAAKCGERTLDPRWSLPWDKAACEGAITGKQGENEPCGHFYECQPGLTCVGPSQSADGYCSKPRTVGKSCGFSQNEPPLVFPFDPAMYCEEGAQCFDSLCVATPGPGQSCVAGPMAITYECGEGYVCAGPYNKSTCVPRGSGAKGDPCKNSDDCIPSLDCRSQDGQGSFCSEPIPVGGSCPNSNGCLGRCDSSNICQSVCGVG